MRRRHSRQLHLRQRKRTDLRRLAQRAQARHRRRASSAGGSRLALSPGARTAARHMTRVPKPQPATTLHERIRAEIEEQILTGAWRPGHRIPYEHELTAQFGCARMTVNKAIASLVDAGLIVRRRRVGSFVAQP